MKRFLAEFILFYWNNYIKEDWDVLTTVGKIYYAVPWFIRSVIFWMLSPLAIPEFLIKRSKWYGRFLIFWYQHI